MSREEREDAIDIIQSILDKYEEDECLVTEITIGDEDIKAFKMAIKALEQEPTTKNDLGVEKIIDEVEKEFEKVDIPIMDKLTIFAKIQNALYKCAVSNNSVGMIRPKMHWIDHSDEGYVECPKCGSATNCDDNIADLHFCFSCGAEMEEVQE